MPKPTDQSQADDATPRISNQTIEILPILRTLRGYSRAKLGGDLRAGINVALLGFTQGMAFAAIAGLPLRYGIFGAAVSSIAGAFFSSSKYISPGPTNATAVMVLSAFASIGIVTEEAAVAQVSLLALLVGCALALGAALRVASLIQYVSRTVITGYIAAASALIVANQLRKTLGFDFTPVEKLQSSTFIESIYLTAIHLGDSHWPTVLLSLATLGLYIALGRYASRLPNVAITLVISSALGLGMQWIWPALQIASLPTLEGGLLSFTLPNLAYNSVRDLISPAIAIALICMLEGNSIGKSLAAREGARINGNQELFSAGMANIGCALFSGMPASGSLTRSKLNVASGAATPISGLISGVIVLAGAAALSPYVTYIPAASLAVIVIANGVSLLNIHHLRLVTKATRSDAITFYTTFLCGLFFALDFAIYAGTVCSIALFLRKVASPEIVEYAFDESGHLAQLSGTTHRSDPEVSIVHVEGEIFFGAAELFHDQMRRVSDDPNLKIVVMKLRNAHNLDATSCMALEELIRYMNEHDRILLISEVRPDTLRILQNSGLVAAINPINLFPDEGENPTLSTAKALRRAKEILGHQTPKVSIYAKQKRAKDEAKGSPLQS